MEQLIDSLPHSVESLIVFGLGWAVLSLIWVVGWIVRQWLVSSKSVSEKLTTAVLANTMAIQKLEIQIQYLNDSLNVLPKLRGDIDAAHEKIRDLAT